MLREKSDIYIYFLFIYLLLLEKFINYISLKIDTFFRKEEALGIWLAMVDIMFRTIYKEFIVTWQLRISQISGLDFEIKHALTTRSGVFNSKSLCNLIQTIKVSDN